MSWSLRILFNVCFYKINLNVSILYLGTFKIFSNIKILLRDTIISGKRVSVCSESGGVLARTWRLRARSIETVSRARRRVSSRCIFHMAEHSFPLVSIVSYFSAGLFLSPVPREISSMPSAYYISVCVVPAPAFYVPRGNSLKKNL